MLTRMPELLSGQIHLWSYSRSDDWGSTHEDCSLLSVDELHRASRYRLDVHRERFIAFRGILRILLGGYLCIRPENLMFVYGPNGKPFVRREPIHFNVAHSGDRALFGFRADRPIGVDIEAVNHQLPAILDRARGIFSVEEADKLISLSPERRTCSFFRGWTRKEAFVKAIGVGLSYPLSSFSVSFDKPAPLFRLYSESGIGRQWSFRDVAPYPGYLGAVATCQGEAQLLLKEFRFGGGGRGH